MHAHTDFSQGALVGSARSARLLRLTEPAHPDKTPVILVSDLTDSTRVNHLARICQLSSFFALEGRPLYLVQWARPWVEGGGERFSPLIRDLNGLIRSSLPGNAPVHLVTLGSGALIGFKWLTHCQREAAPAPVETLSLLAPALSVLGRVPRTSLTSAPPRTCIVTDEAGNAADWPETISLAARLPHPPEFFALRDPETYLLARDSRTLTSTEPGDFIEFAGSWKQAWRDWMTGVHDQTLRMAV